MKYTIKDYELELIDEPLQSHVVAWERATRALKTEDAKPILHDIQAAFKRVDITKVDPNDFMGAFITASKLLNQAIKILDDNETLTSTSNSGIMVKAALQAKWILSFTKAGESILQSSDDVNNAKPWLISWTATQIGSVYLEAVTVPKN